MRGKDSSSSSSSVLLKQLIETWRIGWLEHCAKEIFLKYSLLDKEKPFIRKALHKAFEDSGKAIEELILLASQNNFKIKGFKKWHRTFSRLSYDARCASPRKHSSHIKTMRTKNPGCSEVGIVGVEQVIIADCEFSNSKSRNPFSDENISLMRPAIVAIAAPRQVFSIG